MKSPKFPSEPVVRPVVVEDLQLDAWFRGNYDGEFYQLMSFRNSDELWLRQCSMDGIWREPFTVATHYVLKDWSLVTNMPGAAADSYKEFLESLVRWEAAS